MEPPADTEDSSAPGDRIQAAQTPGGRRSASASSRHWPTARFTYDFAGVAVAFVFAWLSFTPSLIPRAGLFQGLVAGVAAVIGYAIGLAITWTVRQFTDRRLSDAGWRRAWLVLWIVGAIGTPRRADHGPDLAGRASRPRRDGGPGSPHTVLPSSLAIVVFVLFVGDRTDRARRLSAGSCACSRRSCRSRSRRGSRSSSSVFVIISFVSDVVVANTLSAIDTVFATTNGELNPDVEDPDSATVSGGPASGGDLGVAGTDWSRLHRRHTHRGADQRIHR